MTSFFDQVPMYPDVTQQVTNNIFSAGGSSNTLSVDLIEYFDGLGSSDAVSRGDLQQHRGAVAGGIGDSANLSFIAGGRNFSDNTVYNLIDYFDRLLLIGNGLDKGDLTAARHFLGGTYANGLVFFAGGDTGPFLGSSPSDIIDSINGLITTGSALDKGDLVSAKGAVGGTGVQSSTQSCTLGGGLGSLSDIERFDNTTQASSNASDVGDLSTNRGLTGGTSANGIGFVIGGQQSVAFQDIIETFDPDDSSPVVVSDKGDLVGIRTSPGAQSNDSFCFCLGGQFSTLPGANQSDMIQRINATTTTENAIDHADLVEIKDDCAGV